MNEQKSKWIGWSRNELNGQHKAYVHFPNKVFEKLIIFQAELHYVIWIMGENTTKYHYKFQTGDIWNQIQVIPILIVVLTYYCAYLIVIKILYLRISNTIYRKSFKFIPPTPF